LTVGGRTFAAPFFFSITACRHVPCCALVKTLDAAQCAIFSGGPSERGVPALATDRDRFCASCLLSRTNSAAAVAAP
jgi:hypothetical protein